MGCFTARIWRAVCSGTRVRPGAREEVDTMGSRLYVGNLPFTVGEAQLRQLFEGDGRVVTNVKLVMDRDTGRPRGFAFVEMGSPSDAQACINALNGYNFDGRALTVNEARERESHGGGGGGGYSLGGGGGGGGYGQGRRY